MTEVCTEKKLEGKQLKENTCGSKGTELTKQNSADGPF